MIRVHQPRRPFRMALTPMIDVVFLLLVFFMLAARFGMDGAVTLTTGSPSGAYDGPPRLVTIETDGVRLNGRAIPPGALLQGLRPLMSEPDNLVVLRPGESVDLQALVDVMTDLNSGGLFNLVVVE